MDDTRQKLIAWIMGDLSAEEFRDLVPKLAANNDLERQRRQLETTIGLLREVASDDASDDLVRRTVAAVTAAEHVEHNNIIRVNWWSYAAAAASIIVVLGLGVWFTPGDLEQSVGYVTDGGAREVVLNGHPVESRVGETRRLTFPTGEVLIDGASTVRVYSTGEYSAPRIEVERGRVVVTAASADMTVNVAGRDVKLSQGAMLSVNYDRAYANIARDGSFVEIQRVRIADVAAMAEGAYGIKLDATGLPQGVRDARVTFYGSDLDANSFIDSFVEASKAYGVTLDSSRQYLGYRDGTSGPVRENAEWQLDLALLQGRASVDLAGKQTGLDRETNFVTVSAEGTARAIRGEQDDIDRQVVWAAGTGGKLGEHLRDVRRSNEDLPAGTVIHSDAMVLHGDMGNRIYKLGASEYDYILPGGRKGRLVQVTACGVVFEVKGEVVREFVPFGEQ